MQEEHVQIDEVAELLGQFACKNKQVECQQNAQTHLCWDIQLALELIVAQVEVGQLDEVAELLGQFTCTKKWNVSETHKRMYDGTYNSPWNLFLSRKSLVKLTSLPSSLGSSPAQKDGMSANIQCMYDGAYKSHRRDHMRPS